MIRLTDWNTNGVGPLGLTKTFATGLGNITANLTGTTYNGTVLADNRSGRDRGANPTPTSNLDRDFVFAQIFNQASGQNFGRNYIKLVLSGLTAGKTYSIHGMGPRAGFHLDRFYEPDCSQRQLSGVDRFGLAGRLRWPRRVDGRERQPRRSLCSGGRRRERPDSPFGSLAD